MSKGSIGSLHTRIIVSAAAIYSLAMLANWTQPMLVGELMGSFGISALSAGLIPAAEMAALAISSMLCAKYLPQITYRRIIAWAIILIGAGNLASIYIASYLPLLIVRIVCGIGAGLLLMVSSAVVANFDDSDRAYGQINTACVIAAMVAFAAAPLLPVENGIPLTFPILFIFVAILLPFSFAMPGNLVMSASVNSEVDSATNNISLDVVLIAIAVFISCCIFSSIWPYYVLLGERAGLPADQINIIMTYSILFTLIGSMTASFIGHKFGRLRPAALGLILMTVAIVSLSISSNTLVYRLFTGLNLLGLYIFIPYFLGYASQADHSGRGPAIVAGTFMLAAAAGPYLGGAVLSLFDIAVFAWIAPISNLIAFVLLYTVSTRQRTYLEEPDVVARAAGIPGAQTSSN